MAILIKGGQVIDPGRVNGPADVLIDNGRIVSVGQDLQAPAGATVIQAAGRCNREGRLGSRGGRVVVYAPVAEEAAPPTGVYASQTAITRDLFLDQSDAWSFDSQPAMEHYFGEVWRTTKDAREGRDRVLGGYRRQLDFPDLAREFRMIEEQAVDVVIVDHPDESIARAISGALDSLSAHPLDPIPRSTRRLLQRHSATVSRHQLEDLTHEMGRIRVWSGRYDPRRGVVSDLALTW